MVTPSIFPMFLKTQGGGMSIIDSEIPLLELSTGEQEYSYASLTEADTFLQFELEYSTWSGLTDDEKIRFLIQATRSIDRLSILGQKHIVTQPLEFPRGVATLRPVDIIQSCSLIANALADDVDPMIEFENLAMVSQSTGTIKSAYDSLAVPENVYSLIPCGRAWRLLKPFLRSNKEFVLKRVS